MRSRIRLATARAVAGLGFLVALVGGPPHDVPRVWAQAPAGSPSTPGAEPPDDLLAVLASHYPAQSQKIEAAWAGLDGGTLSPREVGAILTGELGNARTQAVHHADEATMLAMLASARRQLVEIRAKSEDECDYYVLEGTTRTPLVQLLGPGYGEHDRKVLTGLLLQAATRPATLGESVTEDEILAIQSETFESVVAPLPPERREAIRNGIAAGETAFLCTWMQAFLGALEALPPARRAAAYQRYSLMKWTAQ